MAPCAADRLMTRPSPGLRPPSPGGRGISAEVSARRRLVESLLPPGEGARRADEGRVIRSDRRLYLSAWRTGVRPPKPSPDLAHLLVHHRRVVAALECVLELRDVTDCPVYAQFAS